MMRYERLEHRFVDHVPERLEPGILYVSMKYGTVVHSCCCGCGAEVVTPLTPTDWEMRFNGATVSLWPSIGSWSLPCRSHYVIERGRAIQASPWTEQQVALERGRDRAAKAHFYRGPKAEPVIQPSVTQRAGATRDLWSRLKHWLCSP